jgi:hypothetical protein
MDIIHIVGCGPTGMSIAWELSKLPNKMIHVYDKKLGPGGSWWEPKQTSENRRDLHAYRSVFKGSFVNTVDLFDEMGIEWSDVFGELGDKSPYGTLLENLSPLDYWRLTSLSVRVLVNPWIYREISIKEATGGLSLDGRRVISSMPFVMDGVSWDTMSAYEFVKSFDWIGMGTQQTQIVSGAVMSDHMEKMLKQKGVNFHYERELAGVSYKSDGTYEAAFLDSEEHLSGGLLVLAVDHGPAQWLIGDNWGVAARRKLEQTTYKSICFLLEYDEPQSIPPDVEMLSRTSWHILASVLEDGKTVCCVLVDFDTVSPETGLTVASTPPGLLVTEVLRQSGLRRTHHRFCWGSEWDGDRWVHGQTSGLTCDIPFFGKNQSVALCGMMSSRGTPFASIEAAIEVGRLFTQECFGVGRPLRPFLITDLVKILLIMLLMVHFKRSIAI